MRAIGVSHTACKDEFRRNLRSHSWSVFSIFIIILYTHIRINKLLLFFLQFGLAFFKVLPSFIVLFFVDSWDSRVGYLFEVCVLPPPTLVNVNK